MKRCPKKDCPSHDSLGASIFDSFCTECGSKLEEEPLPKCVHCEECLSDSYNFCAGCGRPRAEALQEKVEEEAE